MNGRRRTSARPAPPADAGPGARLRSIGEVAAELDLDPHVLRFWETRFWQVRPVRAASRHRLYSPDQVALLRGIRALIHEDGMRIRGVRKTLEERGTGFVAARGALKAELTLVPASPAASRTGPDAGPERARAGEARVVPQSARGSHEPRAGQPSEAIRAGIARLERALAQLRGR